MSAPARPAAAPARSGLVVDRLSVSFGNGAARQVVVRDLSFRIEPGMAVALVGESGSGKSVTARSLVGLAGRGATVSAKALRYDDQDLLSFSERQWRDLRGREIGFVLQDALVSLDPLRPVGSEIIEAMAAHGWGDRRRRQARMLELLELAGVPEPALRARQRPGELSGGLRQRALIASALALHPGLVIADEPTTALDASIQAQILRVLRAIKERGDGLLIISHDLAVVAQLADEILVLHHGNVVEKGRTTRVLGQPRHPYTRALLDAIPGTHPRGIRLLSPGLLPTTAAPASARRERFPKPVLIAENVSKRYRGPDGTDRIVVDQVSFTLHAGRTLGIVGESGSGKTTLARIALGLTAPDAGSVMLRGQRWNAAGQQQVPESVRRPRRRELGIIYQDPLGSFDPRWNVGQILGDALAAGGMPRAQWPQRVGDLLSKVRLSADHATRNPLRLSGGQRQRVAIARAIACHPAVIVCDEPVSALDVSVQAQVLDLLADLQDELGVAYLFISHDLGVIRHVSDDLLVMRDGRVLEAGPIDAVFTNPEHAFTRELIATSSILRTERAATGDGRPPALE